MIELLKIKKSFHTNKVLKGVSLKIEKGVNNIILGQSGGGKSVLMKIAVGLIRSDSGRIIFENEDITNYSDTEYVKFRKKCCYNFQLPALLKARSVLDNIVLPLSWEGQDWMDNAERINKVISLMDLEDILHLLPSELSYGMQKRVSFARALVMDPEYIIFDEPTSGLDPMNATIIYDIIKMISEDYKKGTLVVTHDIDGARYLGGNINLLHRGKFIFQGPQEDFFATDHPIIDSFIRE